MLQNVFTTLTGEPKHGIRHLCVLFTSCDCSIVADCRRQPRATWTATATMSSTRRSARRMAEPSSHPVTPAVAPTNFSPTAPRFVKFHLHNLFKARFI